MNSYTDESRLAYFQNHNGQAPPPGLLLPESTSTPGGRITWDRWVSINTGAKLYNYAVSGAVCDNNQIYRYLASISGPFPDVVYEVNAFIADSKYVNATTKTNTLYTDRYENNTVYSMWIGTNDLGAGAFLTDSSLNKTTIPDYVDCIYNRFDKIYANGGRYFMLMNTAPLQLSPLYGMSGAGGLAASHYWPDKASSLIYHPESVLIRTASKYFRSQRQNERIHFARQLSLRVPHSVRTFGRETVPRGIIRCLRCPWLDDRYLQQSNPVPHFSNERHCPLLPLRPDWCKLQDQFTFT